MVKFGFIKVSLQKMSQMLKYVWWRLVKSRQEPHQIALGFGIGAFIGVFPTFGLGLILILGLGAIIKFHVPAAIAGTLVANPFLGPFWIFMSVKVGNWVLGGHAKEVDSIFPDWLTKIFKAGTGYLLGNLVLSILAAIVSYFIVLLFVTWYQKMKNKAGACNEKK